jgi:RNA polymerase sigma factor (sigma-70 family)
MKINPVSLDVIKRAVAGDLAALDELLATIQGGIYNLAVRMLGNREDARDACQEILLKVTTHLASFRSESAFSTWVYQISRNHLLNASTRSKESPEVSFDALSETLQKGLDIGEDTWYSRALQPDEKLAAREMAITCTQGMLLRLDREHRLAYLLDAVFGLPSQEAAQVLEISPEAYRKRLSRARQSLEEFSQSVCGLVNKEAACQCEKQVHAVGVLAGKGIEIKPVRLFHHDSERAQATKVFDNMMEMSEMAQVLRQHPDWQAPSAMREAIRLVLSTHTPHEAGTSWTRTPQ